MENFDYVYDDMAKTYSMMDSILGQVYEKVRTNPNNQEDIALLKDLATLAKSMINNRMVLTDAYCTTTDKESILGRLEATSNSLNELTDTNSIIR